LRRQRRGAGQRHAIEEAAAIDERPVRRAAHISLLSELIPMLGALLFNHLVSPANQRQRHCHAERFGGCQIDKQLDFRDLLDRKIGRLLALENATS
jgi:hypothetical protein